MNIRLSAGELIVSKSMAHMSSVTNSLTIMRLGDVPCACVVGDDGSSSAVGGGGFSGLFNWTSSRRLRNASMPEEFESGADGTVFWLCWRFMVRDVKKELRIEKMRCGQ